jgi:hypothetical protein
MTMITNSSSVPCRHCKKLVRADQVGQMLRESDWVQSLGTALGAAGLDKAVRVDAAALVKWAQGQGRKLAPGLALVRSPEQTAQALAARLAEAGAPLKLADLLDHLAAAHDDAVGLQKPCPYCGGEGSSRVDLQACKLGTGRRFTTS